MKEIDYKTMKCMEFYFVEFCTEKPGRDYASFVGRFVNYSEYCKAKGQSKYQWEVDKYKSKLKFHTLEDINKGEITKEEDIPMLSGWFIPETKIPIHEVEDLGMKFYELTEDEKKVFLID
jgi:hypothetical protein